MFPVVLRGSSRGSCSSALACGRRRGRRERLLGWYDRLETPSEPNIFLQEYIPGESDSVWMFNGYFGAFRSASSVSPGGSSGSTRSRRRYQPRALRTVPGGRALLVRLMPELGYCGIVDAGFRFDERDGDYKLLDVNPRLGISFACSWIRPGWTRSARITSTLPGNPLSPGSRATAAGGGENLDISSAAQQLRKRELTLCGWLASIRHVDELVVCEG